MRLKIVLTGPESTGKTSLCNQLSTVYKGTAIPEYSREYLQKLSGHYQLDDLVNIGIEQHRRNAIISTENTPVFCDTDALNVCIWASVKFHVQPDLLLMLINEQPPDLYLLCYPDLKWEYDPLRESQHQLENIFFEHLNLIRTLKAPYGLVDGHGISRLSKAVFLINNRFQEFINFAA